MNAANRPIQVKELLRQAFQQYQQNPETVVPVADQILCAAIQAPKLNFTPTPSGRLAIAIGDDESLEVSLPNDSVSSFRTLLARFGVICSDAAQKRSTTGKLKASLKRAGLMADKTITEKKGQVVEYISAVIREQPGSPLYKIDADLDVKQPNGKAAPLHLMMQNELQKLFLLIESRNPVGS